LKRRHHRGRKKIDSDIPHRARKARKGQNSEEKKTRKYGPVKIYIEEEEFETSNPDDEK